ncbi:MAG TPA: efflux RND transporter periplasmic adaptor subunit [Giesbergeria sp.]|jgi:HlyD family secretion protein|nr:efflux RND transporter periplasmic adaptor subunit [Giesbergeria sp.]
MRNTLTSHPATLALAVFLLASAGLWTYSSATHAQDSAKSPRPALTVQTAPPQRTAMTQRLAANGNVAAWQEASIGAESNGLRLTEVRVNVGDSVKAGQVLATFAAEMVQADVAQARASLLEAKAHAAEAASNAERARTLQASGALSAQQIEQYTTAAQAAQARVEAAQALLQAQQLRLQHTQVRAPDHGVISARSATVGAVVGAGTELFRMVRKGRLEWRAEVTATELGRLRPGTAAQVTAASGASVQGQLRMVAPTVDPQTRNALVYVDLPAHPDLRAGMFARGEFLLGQSDALTVPQEALVVREGFTYLFVLGADQRVQRLKVQPGRRAGERVEILSGLDAGAPVVVRGAGFLNDGDLVRVASGPEKSEEKPAAAPANQAQPAIK